MSYLFAFYYLRRHVAGPLLNIALLTARVTVWILRAQSVAVLVLCAQSVAVLVLCPQSVDSINLMIDISRW